MPLVPTTGTSQGGALAVGISHPRYGVMRATMRVVSASSLTDLANLAGRTVAENPTAYEGPGPVVFVAGPRPGGQDFVDVVDGQLRCVVGVVVFRGALDRGTEIAPLALVAWCNQWLPYFEDAGGWVMTGWGPDGRVAAVSKPFGWGGHTWPGFNDRDDTTMDRESRGSNTGDDGERSVTSSAPRLG
jgi:hypothetical protein